MSQHLYNKVILEKIAEEESKSKSGLLAAGGVGLAGAGLGAFAGNRSGTTQGNKLVQAAKKLGDENVAKQIAQGVQDRAPFLKNVREAEFDMDLKGRMYNQHRDHVYNAKTNYDTLAHQHAMSPNAKMRSWMVDSAHDAYRQAAHKQIDLGHAADDALEQVRKAQGQLKGMDQATEGLVGRARSQRLNDFRAARAQRTSMINKATGKGAAIGGGLALGAYGAKKLYDKYKGSEKKASYEYATLEKIAEQDDKKTGVGKVVAGGALAGGVVGGAKSLPMLLRTAATNRKMIGDSAGSLNSVKSALDSAQAELAGKPAEMKKLREDYDVLKNKMQGVYADKTLSQRLKQDLLDDIYRKQYPMESRYTHLNSGRVEAAVRAAQKAHADELEQFQTVKNMAKGFQSNANRSALKNVAKGGAIGGGLALGGYGAKKLYDKYKSK
jgi:hypothetical protein